MCVRSVFQWPPCACASAFRKFLTAAVILLFGGDGGGGGGSCPLFVFGRLCAFATPAFPACLRVVARVPSAGKYVPPHLRRTAAGPGPSTSSRGNDDRRGGGRDERRGGGRRDDDRRAPAAAPVAAAPAAPVAAAPAAAAPVGGDSRFARAASGDRGGYGDDRRGGGGGGYGDDRRGGGGWGGGGRGYDDRGSSGGGGGGGYARRDFGGGRGGRGRVNEQGFHGNMREDSRLEAELFTATHHSEGINFDKYNDIPVETSDNGCPEPFKDFDEDILPARMVTNIKMAQYHSPTPVQKYALPIGLADRDLMACAQTGSGKTAGFLFPTIAQMLKHGAAPIPTDNRRGRSRKCYPNCLILAPTRELASQIHKEAAKFCYRTGIAPVVVYGGADMRGQLRELERGCDMLVATPGRLVDMIERGRISLECVRHLILDEADRMLDMGFEPQIRRIVEEEGMSQDRQTFMFSATFPKEIQRLAADFLHDYIFLAVGRVGSAAKDIVQHVEYVEGPDKPTTLVRFLNTITKGLILVFVETKRAADHLEDCLCRDGYPATSIHGDRSQREREEALSSFKSGRTPILVATDVASRGLDISNVTHVINYDMPNNIDDYVHRIGRTGRVGNSGTALSFMNERNRNVARDLMELLVENGQEHPAWLSTMCQNSFGRGGRGGGRRGGGSRFGARDFRQKSDLKRSGDRGSRSSAGGRSGGGSWGGRSGGRSSNRNSAPADDDAW